MAQDPERPEGGLIAPAWRAVLRPLDVRFGAGALETVAEAASELGARRPLIVTDPGVRAAGHVERARVELERAGLAPGVFDGAAENPEEEHVARGVAVARAHAADLLIGLGGGSAMDCAKGINFVLTNGGRMEDYWGYGKARLPMLPSIGIPSTAGTGSEAQSYAVISRPGDHHKMACGDPKARFRVVLLDPTLPPTAPRRVVAVTGIDAVAHAVESQTSRPASPLSRLWSQQAFHLLRGRYREVVAGGAPPAAWADMLLGAHLAGAAIEAAMLGAAHACANPLTARYGITHGEAVALMLPAVVRWNGAVAAAGYRELVGGAESDAAERLAGEIESLRRSADLLERLRDAAVPGDDLPALAREASTQWTAGFNPRTASEAGLLSVYQSAW